MVRVAKRALFIVVISYVIMISGKKANDYLLQAEPGSVMTV